MDNKYSECCECGTKWITGQDGSHSCIQALQTIIANDKDRIKWIDKSFIEFKEKFSAANESLEKQNSELKERRFASDIDFNKIRVDAIRDMLSEIDPSTDSQEVMYIEMMCYVDGLTGEVNG